MLDVPAVEPFTRSSVVVDAFGKRAPTILMVVYFVGFPMALCTNSMTFISDVLPPLVNNSGKTKSHITLSVWQPTYWILKKEKSMSWHGLPWNNPGWKHLQLQ